MAPRQNARDTAQQCLHKKAAEHQPIHRDGYNARQYGVHATGVSTKGNRKAEQKREERGHRIGADNAASRSAEDR